MSGTYSPGATPPEATASAPIGATSGFTAAMASTAFIVAAPITVPRDVVRLSMASVRSSLFVVGGTISSANPAKATMPMRVPATWSSTKVRAASWAMARRLGSTSVAHIERDTSRARMIEVRPRGTSIDICGRAVARARAARLARNSATGTWRCHGRPPGQGGLDEGDAGVAEGVLALAAQLPEVGAEQQRHEQQEEQRERGRERHRYTSRPNHTSDSPAPSTKSTMLAAVTAAVTSVRSASVVTRRSMLS